MEYPSRTKTGNSVIRHRITRLIRESYRLNEDRILEGLDIVVVARTGAKGKLTGKSKSHYYTYEASRYIDKTRNVQRFV